MKNKIMDDDQFKCLCGTPAKGGGFLLDESVATKEGGDYVYCTACERKFFRVPRRVGALYYPQIVA